MNVSVIRREITHILSISGWFLIVIVFKKETCASRESKQKNEVLPHHLLSEKFKEFYSTPRKARAGSRTRTTSFATKYSTAKLPARYKNWENELFNVFVPVFYMYL